MTLSERSWAVGPAEEFVHRQRPVPEGVKDRPTQLDVIDAVPEIGDGIDVGGSESAVEDKRIGSRPANQPVVAAPAIQTIGAGASVERVVPAQADEPVAAAMPVDHVGERHFRL